MLLVLCKKDFYANINYIESLCIQHIVTRAFSRVRSISSPMSVVVFGEDINQQRFQTLANRTKMVKPKRFMI